MVLNARRCEGELELGVEGIEKLLPLWTAACWDAERRGVTWRVIDFAALHVVASRRRDLVVMVVVVVKEKMVESHLNGSWCRD